MTGFGRQVASAYMAAQNLSEQAREAILAAITKAAPSVTNSPAGIRALAEAFAMLERGLIPSESIIRHST